MSRARVAGRWLAAVFFVGAGMMHFVRPTAYESIVPQALPSAGLLVAISGAAEIAGGLGLLHPRTRTTARWGLIVLLIAVFPANVNMALHPDTAGRQLPHWLLWARLPLQLALIAWVVAVTRRVPMHPLRAGA